MSDTTVGHERELREAWQHAHDDRHKSEHEALIIAGKEINRRLDDMNKLRDQIEAERGKYLNVETYQREHSQLRDVVEARFSTMSQSLDERIKTLETQGANMQGRFWMMSALVGLIVFLGDRVMQYLRP